jgi:YD repeat-containing protein
MSVGERPPSPRTPVPIDLRGIPALARLTGSEHVRWVGWKYEWIPKGRRVTTTRARIAQ